MTEIFGTILVLFMLAIYAARAVPPVRAPVDGRLLLETHPGPLYRLLDQRVNIISIMAVLALGSGLVGERWVSHGIFLVAVIVIAGLLVVPQRYQFTSAGISPNRASFQPWSAFTGWRARGSVIWLNRGGRFGTMKLYLGRDERDEALKIIRRHVRAAR